MLIALTCTKALHQKLTDRSHTCFPSHTQRLANKLGAIEAVVDKINTAIKGAPPILPEDDDAVNSH